MLPPGEMTTLALAALLEAQQDLVLDLHVPGEVVFAGLQHRARRRHRVAAALHLERVEVRPVVHVVVRVDDARHHVARLEVLEHVGAGADRLEVGRRVARLGAHVVGVQVLGNDHALGADEGERPERRRLVEQHLDRVVVDLLDLDVLVGGAGGRRRRRIARVFPVEDDVVGGERLAVVPLHALLQLPGHRLAVGRQGAVLAAGNRLGQHRLQVAVGVPVGQRLVEEARAVLVLGADREVRIEQRRRPATTAPSACRRRRAWSACRSTCDCAIATPEMASSCVAIGAVSPTATMRRTKPRRDSRPVFTSSIRPRNSRSFMSVTPSWPSLRRSRYLARCVQSFDENRLARRSQRRPACYGGRDAWLGCILSSQGCSKSAGRSA